MKLLVKRVFKGQSYTIGKLYIDGAYACDTLEDPVRDLPMACPNTPKGAACKCKGKVYAQTAIPTGTYKVTMEFSPRFKRVLPYLHNVPHFLGILIHPGTDESSTAGCIIAGNNTVKGKVLNSRVVCDKLNSEIATAIKQGKSVTITVR